MSPIIYASIADIIVFLHGVIVAYLCSEFVFSVVLGRKLPTWFQVPFMPIVLIALAGYIFLGDCPINPVERYFRELAGQSIYEGSFVVHYLKEIGLQLDEIYVSAVEMFSGVIIGILFFNSLTKKLDAVINTKHS